MEVTGAFLAHPPSVPDAETEAQREGRTCHNRNSDLLTLSQSFVSGLFDDGDGDGGDYHSGDCYYLLCPRPGISNLFLKGTDSRYFRLCKPDAN